MFFSKIWIVCFLLLLASQTFADEEEAAISPAMQQALQAKGITSDKHTACDLTSKTYFVGTAPGQASKPENGIYRFDNKTHAIELCIPGEEIKKYIPNNPDPRSDGGGFSVSNSGKYIALGKYFSQDAGKMPTDIILFDSAKKTGEVLLANGQDNRHYFFSPDDNYLLFYSYPPDASFRAQGGEKIAMPTVRLCDMTCKKIIDITPPNTEKVDGFQYSTVCAWSPDSTQVAFYLTTPQHLEFYLYEIGAKTLHPLFPKSQSVTCAEFLGEHRLLVMTESGIFLFDTMTRKKTDLVPESAGLAIFDAQRAGKIIRYKSILNNKEQEKSISLP